MNKILSIITIIALVLSMGVTLHSRTQAAKLKAYATEIDALRDDLQTANASITKLNAVAKVRAKDLATARSEAATANTKVQHALEANRSWSDAKLPDSVYESLSGPRTAPQ